MASREKMRQIDAQLQALQPGWGEEDYDGERKMLYHMMGDDEHIERLSAGGWKVLQRGRAMESHDRGIFAATGRGVVFLNKGRLSNNAAKIPYLAILEVQQQGPGELTVVTPMNHYSLSLDPGAAGLADFIRGRLLSDAASLEDSLSDILIGGARIDHWARCKAGEEWVNEVSNPAQAGGDRYHHTDFLDTESLAVATDRRILFCTLEIGYEREYIGLPSREHPVGGVPWRRANPIRRPGRQGPHSKVPAGSRRNPVCEADEGACWNCGAAGVCGGQDFRRMETATPHLGPQAKPWRRAPQARRNHG